MVLAIDGYDQRYKTSEQWQKNRAQLLPGLKRVLDERTAKIEGGLQRAEEADAASVLAAASGTIPDATGDTLLAAMEHLAVLRIAFESEAADVFIERLRRLFLPEALEAARYLGPYRLANLDRFFRQLSAALEEGGGDPTAILRALRRSVAESREAEEGRPKDGAEDAVQVMTIHGAKGLDFGHVYLLQLHKPPGGEGGGEEGGAVLAGVVSSGEEEGAVAAVVDFGNPDGAAE